MPVHSSSDRDHGSNRGQRSGLLVALVLLLLFLAPVAGGGAYLCSTPEPFRLGGWVILGPGVERTRQEETVGTWQFEHLVPNTSDPNRFTIPNPQTVGPFTLLHP